MVTSIGYKDDTLTIFHDSQIRCLTELGSIRNSLLGMTNKCSPFLVEDIALNQQNVLCNSNNKEFLDDIEKVLNRKDLCKIEPELLENIVNTEVNKCSISQNDFDFSDKQFILQFGIYDGFLYPDFELCDGGTAKCKNYPKGATGLITHFGMLNLPQYQLKTYAASYSSSETQGTLAAPSKVRSFKSKPISKELLPEYNKKFGNFPEDFFNSFHQGKSMEISVSKKLYSALFIRSEQSKQDLQIKPITFNVNPLDYYEKIFGKDSVSYCKNANEYNNIKIVYQVHKEANFCINTFIEVARAKNLTKSDSFKVSVDSSDIFNYLSNIDSENVQYKIVKGSNLQQHIINFGDNFSACLGRKLFPSGNPGKNVDDKVVISIPFFKAPDLDQSLKDSLSNLIYEHELTSTHSAKILSGCYFYLDLDSVTQIETTGKISLEVGNEGL